MKKVIAIIAGVGLTLGLGWLLLHEEAAAADTESPDVGDVVWTVLPNPGVPDWLSVYWEFEADGLWHEYNNGGFAGYIKHPTGNTSPTKPVGEEEVPREK
jgi:hypothetical protein